MNQISKVAEALKTHRRFLLTTASPDGDSIGCMLALSFALRARQKDVTIYSPEPVPLNFTGLPGISTIIYQPPTGPFDVMIVVDTGASGLLFDGKKDVLRKIAPLIINFDHHLSNDHFGDLNVVDSDSASTGELIYQLLNELQWDITKDMAVALLTSVMADTGAFRYPNVTPSTYQTAAALLSKGIDNGAVARQIYSNYTVPYVKLLGRMIENLHFEMDGQIGWSVLTAADFDDCGASEETADKMVEQLDMLRDIKVYALLRQWHDGKIKVSFRSRSHFAVNDVAAKFGGGGHRQAAGCHFSGSLEDAEAKVVAELRALFKSGPA